MINCLPPLCSVPAATTSKTTAIVVHGSNITQKVCDFIGSHSNIGPSIFFCVQGVKETFFDARMSKIAATPSNKIKAITLSSREYFFKHGLLLLGAGICNSLELAQQIFFKSTGKLAKVCSKAGNSFFLGASLLGLKENVRQYEETKKLDSKDSKNSDRLFLIRQSAIWGIISNLSYIFEAALVLFGASTAIALVIGVIAAFTGALKALFDFIEWCKYRKVDKVCPAVTMP